MTDLLVYIQIVIFGSLAALIPLGVAFVVAKLMTKILEKSE
jgi:hypothetical protein